jgi:hypothetical protein
LAKTGFFRHSRGAENTKEKIQAVLYDIETNVKNHTKPLVTRPLAVTNGERK